MLAWNSSIKKGEKMVLTTSRVGGKKRGGKRVTSLRK